MRVYNPSQDTDIALQGSESLLPFFSDTQNTLNVTDYDVTLLKGGSLPKNCAVNVSVGRTFTLRPTNVDEWQWKGISSKTGIYRINLMGRGAQLRFSGSGTRTRCVSGVSGRGEVVIQSEDEELQVIFRERTYISKDTSQVIYLDIDETNAPAPGESWKSKVAHWFDADKADSIIKFSYKSTKSGWENVKNEFNGHPIVIGWADAVQGTSDEFLYNTRIWPSGTKKIEDSYLLRVMPYLVEGGLNGRNYLSFGSVGNTVENAMYNSSGKLISGVEVRRLQVWKGDGSGSSKPTGAYDSFQSPYCIMVYNSANGGGKAMLGTDGNKVEGHGDLARPGTTLDDIWTLYSGFSLQEDGATVDPMSEKPAGCWQILSLDMTATNTFITSVGSRNADSQCGGQDYAEIIFFSEKPTAVERADCERYLAEKWGLTDMYKRTVSPTETLIGKSTGTVHLWNVSFKTEDTNAVVTLAGDYKGRINVPEGHTLVVSEKPCPPYEADIPSEGRVGWFDPSVPGALELNPEDTTGVQIDKFWGRTLTGLAKNEGDHWLSAYRTTATGRCAGKSGRPDGVWPFADDLTWLDYGHRTYGNVMRFHDSLQAGVTTSSVSPITNRMGFVVLDTSLGGGSPFGTDTGYTKYIRPRAGSDVSDPIWSASNTVTMTGTWLDTTAVDGMQKGFNGRGEVLSFEAAASFPIGVFAFYNHKSVNCERMGEILLYDRTLSDAERLCTQEYLMYKWLGDLQGKYSDLSGASVTGSGFVRSPSLAALPRYENDFTGATVVTGTALTVDAEAPVAVKGDLSLPNLASVTVNMKVKSVVLATCSGTISVPENVSVSFLGRAGSLSVVGNSLVASAQDVGLLLIVK